MSAHPVPKPRLEQRERNVETERPIALMLGSFFGRGVCRVRLNLCAGLIERGFKVDLLVINGKGEMRNSVPKGVRVIDLKASRALATIFKIRSYISHNNPQAIISAEDHVNVVTLIARQLSRHRPPISVSTHVLHNIDASKPFWTKRYWTRFPVRALYPLATSRIAVSTGMADVMSEVTGLRRTSIDVVFNAIVGPDIAANAKAAVPHPWLADPNVPVILGVGRLTDIKDFPTLIRAFAKLRQTRQIRLMLLGDGHRENNLKALVRELDLESAVAFTGFVRNPFAYLSRAGLFVLSSRHEGLPGVLIQAMACGCPVVSTDCQHGPKEILDNGRFGPLSPVGDVEALARSMGEVLDQPPEPQILKDRAELFEVGTIIEEYRIRLGF